ncbi:hypothetical protein [Sulfurimonas sp.]|uniref:hypothetical protein n=1 Tax=Sulfurimonas sp. TaxID=2022749 RepID=UPI00263330B4|nr:hypothetical protein [Sulfurimonas sp.]MDD5156489.1 hypothetical protein [Sulfurimonas sp.]
MSVNNLDSLRAEFDNFIKEDCSIGTDGNVADNRDAGDKDDNEPFPQFVDILTEKLLAPSISGVYLSRLDIKRIAEAIGESIPIKERVKMVRALFRHTTTRKYLEDAFYEINKHINGRILIYTELSEAFPSSKTIFDEYIVKANKIMKTLKQIAEDFEEIEVTDDPISI